MHTFILTVLALVVVVLGIFSVYCLYAMLSGAPYVPTTNKRLGAMRRLADLKKTETVMDMGSGNGKIVRAIAKDCKRAIGVEINPVLVWISRFKIYGLTNAQILKQNLWKTDLSEVDVLMLYFIPDKMEKLKRKIIREMKPGSRIVSHAFTFPGWQYAKKDDKVYLYNV